MALGHGVLGSNNRNTKKKVKKNLLQNHLAQMLEIWHVAMLGGLLPSLFKSRPQFSSWPWC